MANNRLVLLNAALSILITAFVSGTSVIGGEVHPGVNNWKAVPPDVTSVNLKLWRVNDGSIDVRAPSLLGDMGPALDRSDDFLKMTRTLAELYPRLEAVQFTRAELDPSPFGRRASIMVLPLLLDAIERNRDDNVHVGLKLAGQFDYRVVEATRGF